MKNADAKLLKDFIVEAVTSSDEETVEIRVSELLKIVNDLRGQTDGAGGARAFARLEQIAKDGDNRRMGRLYPMGSHGPLAKTPKPKW